MVHAGLEATTVPGAVPREYEIAGKMARRRLLKVVPEAVQIEYYVALKVAHQRLLKVHLRQELR